MTDTIFTTQTPDTQDTSPAAATRGLGMRFTCTQTGMQVVSGRSWVPTTGRPVTFLWQLWDVTVPGTPVLLAEVDLNTLPAPTPGTWMPVPLGSPVPLDTAKTYVVNQHTSGDADPYVFASGASFPVGSGGSITSDTCVFDHDIPPTVPPGDTSFTGGVFFADVNVDPVTEVIDVGVASEQDHALPVAATVIQDVGIASEQDHAGRAVAPPDPCEPNLAKLTWAVATLLRDCLCTKLLETIGGKVCRCSLMAGDTSIADICEADPVEGDGQAWVRMIRLFVTREFPRPIVDTFNCAGGLWAAEFELGVLRCAVTPDDQGQPPSAQELNCETAKVFDDAYALRITAECCIPTSIPVIPTEWQPMSSGGCTGGRVTVLVYLVPGPHELSPVLPIGNEVPA